MIKLFRKTRQKLLSENKIGAYLKYAIGEILLVVIGILIAVQLNNVNQVKNSDQQTRVYLEAFDTELSINLRDVSNQLALIDENIQYLQLYLKKINSKDVSKLQDSVITNLIRRTWLATTHELGHSSYNDLINSGNLKTVKKPS